MAGRNNPPIGTQCNAWGSVAQTASGSVLSTSPTSSPSNIVDTKNAPFVSAWGHVDGATTINLQYSADGVNFNTAHSVTTAGAADFAIDCNCGGEFVRLTATSTVNATATIQAKDMGG